MTSDAALLENPAPRDAVASGREIESRRTEDVVLRRSRPALVVLGLITLVHVVILGLSIPDYRVTIDAGYHVSLGRWYAEHGPAFWDYINFGPAGRPNLQAPALHVAIAVLGRLLGGTGDAYVEANAILAVVQWAAAMLTAIYFARKIAGDRAALIAGALLAGNAVSSSSFAIGIPSGWIFIAAPWAIDAFLRERLWQCASITSIGIYCHLGGYATAPVGMAVAAILTRRWRQLLNVGALVAVMTAPYTWHFYRYREWYRGAHGPVPLAIAPLVCLLALPAATSLLRRPKRDVFLIAWMLSPIAWLVQDSTRFFAQATLPMSVIAAVWVAEMTARVPSRRRAIVVAAVVLLSTINSPLNASSVRSELLWYGGAKYPRALDWNEARLMAGVIRDAGLANRLVSAYNPSQCVRFAVYAPMQFEKGHWVEVQPRYDPAEDLSAGAKVYVLAVPPDDAVLQVLQRRGWVTVHGGSTISSVVTLNALPTSEDLTPLASAILVDAAHWLAANAVNNVPPPRGVALADWRKTLFEQRRRAGRIEIALVLLAYQLELSDATLARDLRGAGRGFGSVANFLGDDECLYFTAEAQHRRLLENLRAVADAARIRTRDLAQLLKLRTACVRLFDEYFTAA